MDYKFDSDREICRTLLFFLFFYYFILNIWVSYVIEKNDGMTYNLVGLWSLIETIINVYK